MNLSDMTKVYYIANNQYIELFIDRRDLNEKSRVNPDSAYINSNM